MSPVFVVWYAEIFSSLQHARLFRCDNSSLEQVLLLTEIENTVNLYFTVDPHNLQPTKYFSFR